MSEKRQFEHECSEENAPRFAEWIRSRGGIAVWRSVNLSNPSASWSTPAMKADGVTPTSKPTWEAGNRPEKIVTDAKQIEVFRPVEVKRFHVACRRRSGMSWVLTDASDKRVHLAVGAAGEGAYYRFDYETQEAVIFKTESLGNLHDWEMVQRF